MTIWIQILSNLVRFSSTAIKNLSLASHRAFRYDMKRDAVFIFTDAYSLQCKVHSTTKKHVAPFGCLDNQPELPDVF